MKILVLNGSPKSKSDTMVLTNAFLRGLEKAGQHEITVVDGRTRHVSAVDFSKIHTVIICGCGFPNYEHNFEGVSRQCELGFGNLTQIYVPETPLMNEPAAEPVAKIKAASFENAGEEYGKSFSLRPETIEELQSLMIPKQDYLNALNASAN